MKRISRVKNLLRSVCIFITPPLLALVGFLFWRYMDHVIMIQLVEIKVDIKDIKKAAETKNDHDQKLIVQIESRLKQLETIVIPNHPQAPLMAHESGPAEYMLAGAWKGVQGAIQ